jgi:Mn-dependent DtxR family transcriptional regulator
LHDGGRAWKSFDWDAMNRLHEKGLIENPVGKAKSILFTEEGLKEAERLFQKHFAKDL